MGVLLLAICESLVIPFMSIGLQSDPRRIIGKNVVDGRTDPYSSAEALVRSALGNAPES